MGERIGKLNHVKRKIKTVNVKILCNLNVKK